MSNIYAIRCAILSDLKHAAVKSAPLTVDDLIAISCAAPVRFAEPAVVTEQWNELKLNGYIEPVPGFGGKYCRITEKGIKQLSIEFAQDTFIHGPGAV